ncbi:family 2 glycosyl transferase [Celeribacter baekdonensis B30]|uniref:Family 2 glycosyl transferase n=1 Tax=Celeribacter baekdonensis B30 TaxID=1208323 RepID=K2JS49_9RHOB|nr:family 2 glycosyl transferase [Celeribacter baekdonensis B30]KAB6714457.1 glycosyl transferase [Roseobacter sp. TSBP12]
MSFVRHPLFSNTKLHTAPENATVPGSDAPRHGPHKPTRRPIGQILVDMGAVDPGDLIRAAAMRQREDARIGDILLAHGMVEEATLYRALAQQHHAIVADFDKTAPDVRLIDILGADECLRRGLLPWRQVGGTVIIASCRPEQFEDLRPRLSALFGPVRMAVTSETAMHEALLRSRQRKLALCAETRVAAHESCREMDIRKLTRMVSSLAVLGLILALLSPISAAILLTSWAVLTLVVSTGLKIAAAFAQASTARTRQSTFSSRRTRTALPTVSIMLPLFKEREVATRLIKRVSRLSYPRELLDICLVVEEDDTVTQEAIASTDLPRWMRQIIVPRGGVKTKPRAMNFALDFCRGSIIGIYDAEDAPEPEQIHKVVAHFAQTGPEVACVQGILDFYNARTNWLSRCFTVEYATWFRVILPGYERMGLAVPLGGTTLFFRREAIEELGGWDAHNVTEDADLGIRLARHGYRTELLHTVTEEEANCRLWPWVKQRSRWLKGYAMTYAMHMQNPRKLWRDLGAWRFFGVQALFLGALSQFVLAPFLWSFWLFPLGLPHPLRGILPHDVLVGLGATFLLSEVVTVAVGMVATSTSKHKWLWPWVPTLHFYYPLATLAALKGLWEMVTKPYYWDKTAHGVHDLGFHEDEAETAAALSPVSPMPHPAPLMLGPAHRIAASASGAATPQKSAHPLILYPADKPRQNSQEIGADRVRAFGEAPRAFVFERLEQDASGSVPRPGRRLTFGLDFEGTSNTPALRRALEAAAVAFDPERLRPAPKPDPKPDSETVRPDHTETVLALPHQIKDPTPRIPVNSAGAPEWAHMAAFVEVPAFLPTTPAIEPRRMSGTSGDPEEA